MKIFVFSDSHGSLDAMIAILTENPPDMVIHLGDVIDDAIDLESIFPNIPLCKVPGNCDWGNQTPPIQELVVGDVRILYSHGHLWQVKSRLDLAYEAGVEQNSNIVLFGHTHKALCEEVAGVWLLNPGASPSSYGVIEIKEDSSFVCRTRRSPC